MSKRVIRVVVGVIEHRGRYLITQRKESAVLPLLWEFPGGRVEEGETDQVALRRELRERIGVEIERADLMGEHVHSYDGYEVHMHMFACSLASRAEPRPMAVKEIKWVKSDELGGYEFPPADQQSMDKLLGLTNKA